MANRTGGGQQWARCHGGENVAIVEPDFHTPQSLSIRSAGNHFTDSAKSAEHSQFFESFSEQHRPGNNPKIRRLSSGPTAFRARCTSFRLVKTALSKSGLPSASGSVFRIYRRPCTRS